ncbi:MAG: DUF4956 domain-containing protein [Gulosibacter sp.]|uniref:DUF4956 domain-containing protein n=1 Tax=Gulosibacter sp. TaxID=2817531 RepID=UPI003F9103F8
MTTALLLAADLLAISILVFALFVPRHQRFDLVPAYLAVNIGVFSVTTLLASAEVGIGLGLGLFGVLSIIRLRSNEIGQSEVAYYFASLALGLISGFPTTEPYWQLGLLALVVAGLYIGDHPLMMRTRRSAVIQLDRAITDDKELNTTLEQLLGGPVSRVTVLGLDLINDSTRVDVRYRVTPKRQVEAAPQRVHYLEDVA